MYVSMKIDRYINAHTPSWQVIDTEFEEYIEEPSGWEAAGRIYEKRGLNVARNLAFVVIQEYNRHHKTDYFSMNDLFNAIYHSKYKTHNTTFWKYKKDIEQELERLSLLL